MTRTINTVEVAAEELATFGIVFSTSSLVRIALVERGLGIEFEAPYPPTGRAKRAVRCPMTSEERDACAARAQHFEDKKAANEQARA